LNAVTGVLLFAADPRTTGIFLIKMLAVVAGVSFVLLIRRALAANEATPLTPSIRTYAMLSLLTWVVATTTGRLMAYL
jgi:hypothetical protein